jgi:hypothetical protein
MVQPPDFNLGYSLKTAKKFYKIGTVYYVWAEIGASSLKLKFRHFLIGNAAFEKNTKKEK